MEYITIQFELSNLILGSIFKGSKTTQYLRHKYVLLLLQFWSGVGTYLIDYLLNTGLDSCVDRAQKCCCQVFLQLFQKFLGLSISLISWASSLFMVNIFSLSIFLPFYCQVHGFPIPPQFGNDVIESLKEMSPKVLQYALGGPPGEQVKYLPISIGTLLHLIREVFQKLKEGKLWVWHWLYSPGIYVWTVQFVRNNFFF